MSDRSQYHGTEAPRRGERHEDDRQSYVSNNDRQSSVSNGRQSSQYNEPVPQNNHHDSQRSGSQFYDKYPRSNDGDPQHSHSSEYGRDSRYSVSQSIKGDTGGGGNNSRTHYNASGSAVGVSRSRPPKDPEVERQKGEAKHNKEAKKFARNMGILKHIERNW